MIAAKPRRKPLTAASNRLPRVRPKRSVFWLRVGPARSPTDLGQAITTVPPRAGPPNFLAAHSGKRKTILRSRPIRDRRAIGTINSYAKLRARRWAAPTVLRGLVWRGLAALGGKSVERVQRIIVAARYLSIRVRLEFVAGLSSIHATGATERNGTQRLVVAFPLGAGLTKHLMFQCCDSRRRAAKNVAFRSVPLRPLREPKPD